MIKSILQMRKQSLSSWCIYKCESYVQTHSSLIPKPVLLTARLFGYTRVMYLPVILFVAPFISHEHITYMLLKLFKWHLNHSLMAEGYLFQR